MSGAKTVEWEGKYLRIVREGTWEYVERCGGVHAVVILAEHDGKVVLIEQRRVPLGGRKCIELPAGLVGDEDPLATVEGTAVKELEEETGFTAESIEVIGEFHSSPGMVAEGYTLVRAHGVRRIGDGGGNEHEEIEVHLVPRHDIPAFVERKRAEGCAIDTKMLLLLAADILD
ncbi:NUDIX hydrolase [Sphingomonas sp. NSE70-1]|uniref:NUDIX hydrolase n=1 Tax=Sphingomonas caseinilyticus TaxID=2908205 RepID=A0ABT0RSV5_9SPHN|nr:NUDIX hydrolase [Sphingomonas caseinilyticus]MCL6698087.1 NUDIX hydrolase [Sphingomonas caseinilyticus]